MQMEDLLEANPRRFVQCWTSHGNTQQDRAWDLSSSANSSVQMAFDLESDSQYSGANMLKLLLFLVALYMATGAEAETLPQYSFYSRDLSQEQDSSQEMKSEEDESDDSPRYTPRRRCPRLREICTFIPSFTTICYNNLQCRRGEVCCWNACANRRICVKEETSFHRI
ncbi:hypothetical protein SK128_009021 [Halocaridina rubra]|uniref:WAP domain-containing protein n=1 Tax=Halocaridina rubra TaxID=373956 RepID=A0AAN8XAB5_HALRR